MFDHRRPDAGTQGQEARMNQPATLSGNWQRRMRYPDLSDGLAERLMGVTRIYGRV